MNGTYKPYPEQAEDIEKLVTGGGGLLSAEMGFGKSLTAAWAMDRMCGAGQVLVIAPKSTHAETAKALGWPGTVREATGRVLRPIGNGNKAERGALADLEMGVPGWYLTTPQLVGRKSTDISAWAPDGIIADEFHLYGNPGTSAMRKIVGYSVTDRPLGARATYRLALTGTPARNNFERMWSVTRFLWPERNGNNDIATIPFSLWKDQNMASKFSPFTRSGKEYTGELQPGRLIRNMPTVVQHLRRETCCKWHPGGFMKVDEPQVLHVTYTASAKQRKAIKELEASAFTWLEDHPFATDIPLVTQTRVRQLLLAEGTVTVDDEKETLSYADGAASPLMDRIEELLDELGDEPVVLFTDSQRWARWAVNRLNKNGVTAFEFSGATAGTRVRDMEGFGTTYRVAVMQIDAAGTGTDGLQRVTQTEIWASRSLDATNNAQAEARVDRPGQKNQVQRFIMEDDMGYATKRFDIEHVRRTALQKSVRK